MKATGKRFASVVALAEGLGSRRFAEVVAHQLESRRLIRALIVRRISLGLSTAEVAAAMNVDVRVLKLVESATDIEISGWWRERYAKALDDLTGNPGDSEGRRGGLRL